MIQLKYNIILKKFENKICIRPKKPFKYMHFKRVSFKLTSASPKPGNV